MQLPGNILFVLIAAALACGLTSIMFAMGYVNMMAFAMLYLGSALMARPLSRQLVRVVEDRR